MSDAGYGRTAFLKAYVFLIALLVTTGWVLSWNGKLNWLGVFSIPALIATMIAVRRWAGSGAVFFKDLGEPLRFWLFLLVAVFVLISANFCPPTMLDSLTYRLPQIFLWLQNNRIEHVISAEDRLNFMPQSWGLATLPLVQLANDKLVWLWAFISWIVIYVTAYDWAFEINRDIKKSRILAFLGSTSTFAILQATSSANDIFATAMALLSLRFVMAFERSRDWHEINWAVLSFCLAAGTKPHFAVFGLPLMIWFVASPSKPWRAFRWVWSPLLLAIWLLCSPAPSFVLNHQTYGTWAGPGQDFSMTGKGPVWNILLGTTMIVWQNPQPPINPVALLFTKKLDQIVEDSGLKKLVPRFTLKTSPVNMVDTASLGLITSILFLVGAILAFKRNRSFWKSWQGLAMIISLFCIIASLSKFVSSGAGRAFCGFLYVALPLAIVGWNSMKPGTLKLCLYLCLFSSVVSLVFNPSRPLWPARFVQHELASSPRFDWLAKKIELSYLKIPERAITANDIVRAIPSGEKSVVAVVGDDRPLLSLFRPYSVRRKVLFLPPHSPPKELSQLAVKGAHYVVVGGGAQLPYPELCEYLEKSGDYKLVISRDYTSKLVRGPETWKLYQLAESTNVAVLMQP